MPLQHDHNALQLPRSYPNSHPTFVVPPVAHLATPCPPSVPLLNDAGHAHLPPSPPGYGGVGQFDAPHVSSPPDDHDGRPCDENDVFLPPGTPPPPPVNYPADDWTPFHDCVEFEMAELLYIDNQMSATKINRLLNLWAAMLVKHNDQPPFADHQDLYCTIDSSALGEVKWENFQVQYSGEKPDVNILSWMNNSFDVWFRDPWEVVCNMLANPTYADEIDY
ncbi:uncharacterized protein EDB91DRAFT_1250958 [Suillus paluster]|uniref:uncharacterized protein n=1 Tax=Suillus paluster TaxID=48578 RepID=UPI001B88226F|nr:uncharacterized protein EDB91DRAFT_1250958 [Suillus paluster]KAG1734437.1 hypothetical protein EDB91DRAFT_1250958 [Suillus paluster]